MVLICGPFLGDFEQEITCFRPYIKYLYHMGEYCDMFVSSHSNRGFLYDWIPSSNFIPVYEQLSRDEEQQQGYIHKGVNQKSYNLFVKRFKEIVIKQKEIPPRQVTVKNISYIKSKIPYPIDEKLFEPIKTKRHKGDYILFIPHENANEDLCENIHKELSKNNKVVVAGDLKCNLTKKNILAKNPNYFEIGYKYILDYIMGSKLVVTPCSHWTFLCNLQKVPVMSWGEAPSIYKSEGVYGFNNTNVVIHADDSVWYKTIVSSVEYLKEKLERRNANI